MNEAELAPVGLWTLIFLALAMVGVLLLISQFLLIRKIDGISEHLRNMANHLHSNSRQLDTTHAQIVQANAFLGSVSDALYVTVRCFRCGKEVRFPSHCRGHTHPCPLCQTHIAIE